MYFWYLLLDSEWKCPAQSWIWVVCWRRQEIQSFGIISAFTELVKPLFNCSGLSEAQQIDVIKKIETSNLPLNDIHILKGLHSLCSEILTPRPGSSRVDAVLQCKWKPKNGFQFKNRETMALTKTPMEKTWNGMKFIGCQLLLWLIFAGTVHRSQEMTLQRAVIDCCMKFWEHGQLYMAFSGVKSPDNLCILLADGRFHYSPSRWRWCYSNSRVGAIFQTRVNPPNFAWW
jgi:hypothetical protein